MNNRSARSVGEGIGTNALIVNNIGRLSAFDRLKRACHVNLFAVEKINVALFFKTAKKRIRGIARAPFCVLSYLSVKA